MSAENEGSVRQLNIKIEVSKTDDHKKVIDAIRVAMTQEKIDLKIEVVEKP